VFGVVVQVPDVFEAAVVAVVDEDVGAVVVAPGTVVVAPGMVVVAPGAVVVAPGAVVVAPGAVVVAPGTVVVAPGTVVVLIPGLSVVGGTVPFGVGGLDDEPVNPSPRPNPRPTTTSNPARTISCRRSLGLAGW
jgi:hypothetical protein